MTMVRGKQTWHTRIVTELLYCACGDLALDARGHLTTKTTYDYEAGKELPAGQFRHGDKLALISREGWTLTPNGAQFILENCPPEGNRNYDMYWLRAVARSHGDC